MARRMKKKMRMRCVTSYSTRLVFPCLTTIHTTDAGESTTEEEGISTIFTSQVGKVEIIKVEAYIWNRKCGETTTRTVGGCG
ncbi:hypothetical protein BDV98DRAFT_337669 [Pterulicium gracile]|uniref:Uncharacterized protein n=1 Tax=Pterulicium gracile TaxID=1884261 RepID=A0A5C3QCT4_9AGAR|nr:hypothetical protein BDV98DRAFT_337669 [Pterula gracilis]